jgi:patatin-like phospholipase/acyl hydrolase
MTERLATGPRILCIDGGGIRGLSEILILKELMLQVQIESNLDFTPEPWQCFDLICGTSTGGLIAILVGRLGKTLAECEELFRNLGSEIFSGNAVSRTARLVLKGAKHASEGLEGVIEEQAGDQIMFEESANSRGHTAVSFKLLHRFIVILHSTLPIPVI